MRVRLIPPQDQPTLPWRNGLGCTREILRVGPESAFDWRASVALIDASAPFSAFPGYRRWSCLLDGGPLALDFPGGARVALEPRMHAHAYAGDPPPVGELDGAFASLFNLIAANGRVDAQLLPRPLVGSMLLFDQSGTDWLAYLVGGEAELRVGDQRHWLGPQHAVLLEGEGKGTRAVLEGGGEVVLAKVVNRDGCRAR